MQLQMHSHVRTYVRTFVRTYVLAGPIRFQSTLPTTLVAQIFRRRENFGGAKIFEKKIWAAAIIFVKKSSKSELSSRFFGRLKILQDLEDHHETCEVPIWTSCEFLSVTTTFVSKSYPRCPKNQLSMIFGGGLKKSISIFFWIFGPKLTCTFWFAAVIMW